MTHPTNHHCKGANCRQATVSTNGPESNHNMGISLGEMSVSICQMQTINQFCIRRPAQIMSMAHQRSGGVTSTFADVFLVSPGSPSHYVPLDIVCSPMF
ncbi:hypothetical protein HAX54_047019 [Datura stramonium]|uniref:Uncharacterized protein n=1 Tax=Datura stramonium TaxID=4076 RepID=A0ABS8SRT9_DATST|nr:hypothetical protein [Datura stramonium]